MAELEIDEGQFTTNNFIPGLPNPVLACSPFAVARMPYTGKPATPYAARHCFTTRTSMGFLASDEAEQPTETLHVNKFIIARRRIQTGQA